VGNPNSIYNDEAQINVAERADGKAVVISTNANSAGGALMATITTPGWYTFVTEFQQGPGGPNGSILNSFGVIDPAGHLIGNELNQLPNATFLNHQLGQPNYIWLPDWTPSSATYQIGGAPIFANGVVGIANIQAGPWYPLYPLYSQTPEPSSSILCGLGALGLFIAARRHRKA
jgi:hypothetical protein